MNKLLHAVIAPEEGQTESWAHLAPFGEFAYITQDADGNDVEAVQLLDAEAFELIMQDFAPEVLIDREHLSIVSDDTTAMGWVQELDLRGDGSDPEDGLWALVRWTDVGLDHLTNRRLRWLSPVWPKIERADNRPTSLSSVGLTNGARFRANLKPVVNKVDDKTTTKPNTPNGGKDNTMEKLLEMLGVTTAAEAEAKVKALLESATQVETLNKEVEDLKEKNLETEANKVADDNDEKIANKADFIKLYVANKDMAVRMLANLKAPATTSVVNKSEAKAPSFKGAGGGEVLNKLEQFNAMSEGAAKHNFFVANKAELLELEQEQLKDS